MPGEFFWPNTAGERPRRACAGERHARLDGEPGPALCPTTTLGTTVWATLATSANAERGSAPSKLDVLAALRISHARRPPPVR
jgi:hypothetical protein